MAAKLIHLRAKGVVHFLDYLPDYTSKGKAVPYSIH